jgi:hypothetical protein
MNVGIYIVSQIGVFGPLFVNKDGVSLVLNTIGDIIPGFSSVFGSQWFSFGVFSFVLFTVAFFSSFIGRFVSTQQGAGTVIFGVVYYAIWINTSVLLINIGELVPSMWIFLGLFEGFYLLIGIFAIIQLSTGGQKVFA